MPSGEWFEIELLFLDFLCQLNAPNRHGRRLESLEPEHRPPRVINTDKHAAYPPAIAELKADGVLDETLNTVPSSISIISWNRITGPSNAACAQANIFVRSGELAYDRWLGSDSYDPQRPSVLQCRSTAPLHSRSVRGDELKCQSSTPTFGSTTKLQHILSNTFLHSWQLRGTSFCMS